MSMRTAQNPADTPADPKPAQRPPLGGLFWLVVLAAVGVIAAVGLSLWVPHLQRERAISRVKQLGGTVTSADIPGHPGRRIWRAFRGQPLRRVVAIDLTSAELTDDDVRLLLQFRDVEQLSLRGRRLTDDALSDLKRLDRLRFLMLVDCRNISDEAVAKLRKSNPSLRVARRGAALLGIYGRRGLVGCQVLRVREETAAHRGGILVGDEITQVGDRRVRSFESLAAEIARHQPGENITLYVFRRGHIVPLSVTLGDWGDQKE